MCVKSMFYWVKVEPISISSKAKNSIIYSHQYLNMFTHKIVAMKVYHNIEQKVINQFVCPHREVFVDRKRNASGNASVLINILLSGIKTPNFRVL